MAFRRAPDESVGHPCYPNFIVCGPQKVEGFVRGIVAETETRGVLLGPIADADLADLIRNVVRLASGQQFTGPWGSAEWHYSGLIRFFF